MLPLIPTLKTLLYMEGGKTKHVLTSMVSRIILQVVHMMHIQKNSWWKLYFTTNYKHLHTHNQGCFGAEQVVIMPSGQEGIIKFSVMPTGMKVRFPRELLH